MIWGVGVATISQPDSHPEKVDVLEGGPAAYRAGPGYFSDEWVLRAGAGEVEVLGPIVLPRVFKNNYGAGRPFMIRRRPGESDVLKTLGKPFVVGCESG